MLELTDRGTKIIIKTVFHMSKILSKDKTYFFEREILQSQKSGAVKLDMKTA